MTPLRIADTLALPPDAATQTFAFIGRKGSGKTYGSGKLVELLTDNGVQVIILDSVGNWYGLRLGADGRSEGLDIAILGGLRGDVPLEATGGALVADVIVDSGRSLIIDVSQFSKADRQRFATALGERLWLRRKGEHDSVPLHLVIEESQLIVPEQTNRQKDAARMVGIYEEIIRLGRNYGIGVTMITQRPQSVSKEVLNQTECLMVFQVNGAHERKALKEWIVHQGMDTALLAELPSLKPGNCYVWSPQWLEVLQRIRIAPKRTFDSTGTPKAGAPRRGRREMQPIDLDDLKAKMAVTIERAKADDPKALRQEIAALKRQLAAGQKAAPAPERVEVPVLQASQVQAAEELLNAFREALTVDQATMDHLHEAVAGLRAWREAFAGKLVEELSGLRATIARAVAPSPRAQRQAPVAPARRASEGGAALPVGERLVLTACAQYNGCARDQLSILTAYKRSTRDAYVQRLGDRGYVEARGGLIYATDAGVAALGPDYEPLPTGDALHDYWMARLPEGEGKVLEVVCAGYPDAVERTAIDKATGYKRSTRDAYIQRLTARRLVSSEGRGAVRASEALFG